MDRKSIWIVAGAILLGTMLLSVSLAVAQRDFRTEPRSADPGPPHYQVVNVSQGEIIIMDVTTGDLYSAKPQDVKPYNARPRSIPDKSRFELEKEKQKAPRFEDRKDL
jgi:hypothetical protein